MKLHRFAGVAVCVAAAGTACARAPSEPASRHELKGSVNQAVTHLTSALIAPAPTPFEGEIRVEVQRPREATPVAVTYDIKGDKVRYDVKPTSSSAPAAVHTVADLDQHKAFELLDAKKSYVTLDRAIEGRGATPALRTTGKTEAIGGLSCEEMEISDGQDELNVCAFKGIPYFDLSGVKGAAEEPAWAAALSRAKEFPLKVVLRDKKGTELMRMEAKSVVDKRLDDALFTPPTTFREDARARVDLQGVM
jgi:hypothetical protein